MTYLTGDPAHINLGHNELITTIQEMADSMAITVTLPDTAGLGDTGHVADHNLIVAAIQTIADEATNYAQISGTTGSPTISTVTVGGVSCTLYNYGANGTITASVAGKVRACIIGGASSDSGPNYGNVGFVFDGWLDLPASATTITVGATGGAGSAGGGSSVGTLAAAPGGDAAAGSPTRRGGAGRGFVGAAAGAGYASDITGSSVVYGQEDLSTTYGSRTGPTPTAGRVFILIPN